MKKKSVWNMDMRRRGGGTADPEGARLGLTRRTALTLLCATLIGSVVGVAAAATPRPGRTEAVSIAWDGRAKGDGFWGPGMSSDGRYVAFLASALDPSDENGCMDVYLRDRVAQATEWISVGWDGPSICAGSGGAGSTISMTPDGRFVGFGSYQPNLVKNAPGGFHSYVRDRERGVTELVSVDDAGTPFPVAGGEGVSLSADGRYVGFSAAQTVASLPVSADSRAYVRDRVAGRTEMVSVDSDEIPIQGSSYYTALSADGRFVAFQTTHSAFTGPFDVYLRDRVAGTTTLISGAAGAPGQGMLNVPGFPDISADGRYVAFLSSAKTLVPRDRNADAADVFVYDRVTGATERVSVSSSGTEGAEMVAGPSAACLGLAVFVSTGSVPRDAALFPSISDDGRYVGFISLSDNLVPGDTNQCWDAFIHDRVTRETERASVSSAGSQMARAAFWRPEITPGGRFAAFTHYSDMDPNDTNRFTDTYVRDRGPENGAAGVSATLEGGTVTASGWAAFSGSVVTAGTDAPDGQPGLDLTGASLVYRPSQDDVLVRLAVDGLPPVESPAAVYGVRLRVGAATYEARASDGSTALWTCAATCVPGPVLAGSIGSTGQEVLISIPLSAIGATEGTSISGLRAFASLAGAAETDGIDLGTATIPTRTVALGIAPAGTPESAVSFAAPASLEGGTFTGTLDASFAAAGEYEVWARGCLGAACGSASTPLTIG